MGTGFIARDRELAELLAGLQDAAHGRGGVFLIAGEPGIGKTALAGQVADHAARQGARVLWGRSWKGDGAAPYWAWSQVIRTLAEGVDEATLRSLLTPETAPVARLAPQLADRFGDVASSIRVLDSDAGRFFLFEATARFLKQASAIHPLLLILDDLLSGGPPLGTGRPGRAGLTNGGDPCCRPRDRRPGHGVDRSSAAAQAISAKRS